MLAAIVAFVLLAAVEGNFCTFFCRLVLLIGISRGGGRGASLPGHQRIFELPGRLSHGGFSSRRLPEAYMRRGGSERELGADGGPVQQVRK